MPEGYIIDAVRTPVGKRGGSLAAVHSADLGTHGMSSLVRRTAVDPNVVDDVISAAATRSGPRQGTSLAWPGSWQAFPTMLPGHDRPSVWLLPTGDPFLRAGSDVGHPGTRGRRWRPEHECDSHLGGHDRG